MCRFWEKIFRAKKEYEMDCVDVWKMEKSLVWTRSEVYEGQYWATMLKKYIESLHGGL